MSFLAIFFLGMAFYMVYCAIDNTLYFLKFPPLDTTRRIWPFVSVCIPARNEEARIGPCLESLLSQDYPHYEVLVLDDQSTDGTRDLLTRYSKKNRHLKILRGKSLPVDWVGKSWACHQLSQKAKGAWILFTDADTWHHPDTLKRSVTAGENHQADLLSCVTGQATQSWLEYLVVPVMVFDLTAFLPARWAIKQGKFGGANGQFLFFNRKAYQSMGGHGSVRGEIVEDLAIGKKVTQRGLRLVLLDGSRLISCRMYHCAKEVIEGFSKNFFPVFDFSLPKALFGMSLFILITVVPFLLPCLYPSDTFPFDSALILALVQVLARLNQAFRFGFPKISCLLHPLGNLLFMMIGLNSIWWYSVQGKGRWKGRELKPVSK